MTRHDEEKARSRYIIISAARMGGVILIALAFGIISNGFMGLQVEIGYFLLVVGLLEFFVVPLFLARMWKTPEQ